MAQNTVSGNEIMCVCIKDKDRPGGRMFTLVSNRKDAMNTSTSLMVIGCAIKMS